MVLSAEDMTDYIEYYDIDSNPITFDDWVRIMSEANKNDIDIKRIAYDKIGDVEASTVWLGLNHAWNPDSPPLIFETMVFGGDDDGWQDRYSTKEQAQTGHNLVVMKIRTGQSLK